MTKIVGEEVGKFNQHNPKLAAIVTASAEGKDGAMTAAWHTSISFRPPLYGISISPKRFTYELIAKSREFGINFIASEKAALAARIGGTSGRHLDKFQKFNLEKEKPIKSKAPILKDAYAAYECRLLDSKPYGDHVWIVGEIVAVHLLEEAFTPEEILNLNKVRPLLYLGSDFYATTDKGSVRFIKRGT